MQRRLEKWIPFEMGGKKNGSFLQEPYYETVQLVRLLLFIPFDSVSHDNISRSCPAGDLDFVAA